MHSYGPDGARDAIRAGADTLEHATDMDDATIAELVRKRIWYVPTINHNQHYVDRADDVFPAIPRCGEIGRHDFRLEQRAAVARRHHERVMRPAGRPIGRRDLCPHGDGNERGRDDERVGRPWRRRRRAKRLLDDDGRDARDGFDADEPRTQRARRDEERCPGGFGVDALFWQIGDAAGPRHRSAVGVVHGDAGVGAAFGR